MNPETRGPRAKYSYKIKEAEKLITHKKDIPILAAVLYAKPDYFLTGDGHFDEDRIKDNISVMSAKEFLTFIRKE